MKPIFTKGVASRFAVSLAALLVASAVADEGLSDDRIRPYEKNPRYWQYRGRPVLLLGGSKDDNLFQRPDLESHLAEIHGVGGNFVRNTMSDRRDGEFEVYPFARLDSGQYDLEQWNDEYWKRFESFLKQTGELEVFVQIEIWDRFDYSQENWEAHPYRPANNVNYTTETSGLRNHYPAPAWRDRQPFFHSIPGMPRYERALDLVRKYQERFVEKILSYSLEYGHVLYCMNNETSTPPRWGRHWMALIQREARRKGVSAYCTDMFDDGYRPEQSRSFAQAFDDPAVYGFIDISQINSRIFDETHWTKMRWVHERITKDPRPINHVKIYGSGETKWGSGTPEDGVERFWRNLFAGCAAVRFHRDGAGNGLRPIARASIRAARKLERWIRFWEVEPHQELLGNREADEAYLVAGPGERYAIYFTRGGLIDLDLKGHDRPFLLGWIDIEKGEEAPQKRIAGGDIVRIETPGPGPHVAALVPEERK